MIVDRGFGACSRGPSFQGSSTLRPGRRRRSVRRPASMRFAGQLGRFGDAMEKIQRTCQAAGCAARQGRLSWRSRSGRLPVSSSRTWSVRPPMPRPFVSAQGASSPARPGRMVPARSTRQDDRLGEVVVVRVAGCRRDLGDAVRVRFGGPAVSTNLLHDSEELGPAMPAMRRRARRFTSFARTDTAVPRPSREAADAETRKGRDLHPMCTLREQTPRMPRFVCARKSLNNKEKTLVAGERTRTADMLITNCYPSRVSPLRARACTVHNRLICRTLTDILCALACGELGRYSVSMPTYCPHDTARRGCRACCLARSGACRHDGQQGEATC